MTTSAGTGRLVQVFRDRSAVVLDGGPNRVTFFATDALAARLIKSASAAKVGA